VGLLDSFEKGLERAVNGAFAKTFKSGLQPIEIASALRRELDTQAAIVSRERILVPNTFMVTLASGDFERMTALGSELVDELTQLVQQHAAAQHYSFVGGISISFEHAPQATPGLVTVSSTNLHGEVTWNPFLEIAGTSYPIRHSHTVVGRGSDADITVDDSSISRKHVEILWDGKRAQVNDLGSTNGSLLNGHRVSTAPLPPNSVIDIGRTRIVFTVLAQTAPSRQGPNTRVNGSTNTVRAETMDPASHLGFPSGDGRHR
jgi:hypothetical protein